MYLFSSENCGEESTQVKLFISAKKTEKIVWSSRGREENNKKKKKFKPCTLIYLLFWILKVFYSVHKNDLLNSKSHDLSLITVQLAENF